MLTKERRPFTEAERERVRALLSETYQRQSFLHRATETLFGLAGGGLLGAFLVFLPLTAWNWLAGRLHKSAMPDTVYFSLLGLGGGAGMIWAAWMMYESSQDTAARLAEERRKFQQDLDADEAEVWHCEVSRVVQLDNEDDALCFFLELDSAQALYLNLYQWDDRPDDEGESDNGGVSPPPPEDPAIWPPPPRTGNLDGYHFPCRRFDLVRTLNCGVHLDLVCLDPRFEEWPTYTPSPESTWEAKCYPEDGDVLPVSLDTLEADLDRWAAQQEPPKK